VEKPKAKYKVGETFSGKSDDRVLKIPTVVNLEITGRKFDKKMFEHQYSVLRTVSTPEGQHIRTNENLWMESKIDRFVEESSTNSDQ